MNKKRKGFLGENQYFTEKKLKEDNLWHSGDIGAADDGFSISGRRSVGPRKKRKVS